MSSEGKAADADFGLIETLLWTRASGYWLLERHEERLLHSAQALGFACEIAAWRMALAAELSKHTVAEHVRLRAVLSRDGSVETSSARIEPVPEATVWQLKLAVPRFMSGAPLLQHKTTRRALYEEAFAEAAGQGADEVLFLNERDEVCEAARCNLFLKRGDVYLTPPLSSGLLPGTLRAELLARGQARETVLHLDDLQHGELFLGNSVRGLVRASL